MSDYISEDMMFWIFFILMISWTIFAFVNWVIVIGHFKPGQGLSLFNHVWLFTGNVLDNAGKKARKRLLWGSFFVILITFPLFKHMHSI